MENVGAVFAECLASLDRDSRAYDSLSEQLSTIVDAAILCLKSGDSSTAARILEDLKRALRGVCGMGKEAKQRDIGLVMAAASAVRAMLTLSGVQGENDSLAEVSDIGESLDRFIGSSIAYLDEPRRRPA
jgi:site-specific recombinase XerC